MKRCLPCGALLLAMVAVAGLATAQDARDPAKHPVLDHKIDRKRAAGYERAVKDVMALSDAEMLAFMPDKRFSRFCECPQCYGGTQGYDVLQWRFERPQELKCKYCGTVVHPNPAFPEDQVLTGKNALGETITYHFYLNPQKNMRHFLSDTVAYYRRQWLLEKCRALGMAYQATGKEEYARRVVLVLDRIAQVYPHYAVMSSGSMPVRHFKFAGTQKPPYESMAGKWGWHAPSDDMPVGLPEIYDLAYDSPEFDRLSGQRGYDVRKRFENDFLRDTFAAVSAAPKHVDNYVAYLSVAAALGRVLGEPRFVHWAFHWMRENVEAGCFYDGMWHESPNYHEMTVSGLRRCLASVQGYSDPPGYRDPVDGRRFDNLVPEREIPFWAHVPDAPHVLDFPDGRPASVHDTWGGSPGSHARETTRSTILPGFGHASLGRGTGANQLQAQLHFSGAYGHHHFDNLNLTLFAKGGELLSDIGYSWTTLRWWATCTIGHNTLAVDASEQSGRSSDGDLLTFFPDTAGVAVVEADGRRAYNQIAGLQMYRRLLVLVPVSAADAYVVDVFRTSGGAVHDWLLHGSADEDMTAACSLPLAERPDALAQKNAAKGYAIFRDLRSARGTSPFNVTFQCPAPRDTGVRIHILGGPASQVVLGRSPSLRRTGGMGDNRKVFDYWMPQLVVRRQGPAPLHSLFAAVEEPFAGRPFLESVEGLPLEPAEPNAVALRVKHGDFVDTVISTLDAPPYPRRVTADGLAIEGRLGIIRQRSGRTSGMWLFEGTSLAAKDQRLTAERGTWSGSILSAPRKVDGAPHDAFVTDTALPEGEALRSAWMIVTHGNGYTHGYQIDAIRRSGKQTQIVLTGDHGLKIEADTTQEAFFPQRTIHGANRFVIPIPTVLEDGTRSARPSS